MKVENYLSEWKEVFSKFSIGSEVSEQEFIEWASGLDGEINNDWGQNKITVVEAANEAVMNRLFSDFLARLDEIRDGGGSFASGLEKAKSYVLGIGGEVREFSEDGQCYVEFKTGYATACAFQPFKDIDNFYYEA